MYCRFIQTELIVYRYPDFILRSSSMGKTIAEKIFEAHLRDTPSPDNMVLNLDVVMCHEITTPIAIMDLVEKGMDRVFDPTRIKAVIDHVTPAKDSKTATQAKIMRDWAQRHGIKDFFDIGRKRRLPRPLSGKRLHPARLHRHHGRFAHLHARRLRGLCRRCRHHRPRGRHLQGGLCLPQAADHED